MIKRTALLFIHTNFAKFYDITYYTQFNLSLDSANVFHVVEIIGLHFWYFDMSLNQANPLILWRKLHSSNDSMGS